MFAGFYAFVADQVGSVIVQGPVLVGFIVNPPLPHVGHRPQQGHGAGVGISVGLCAEQYECGPV